MAPTRAGGRGMLGALALLAGALCAAAAGARAEEAPAVTVIIDGSGSMWGNLEGQRGSKIGLAREAVLRGLGRIAPQTRVGLASFGHRRGDCVDVELLRAPEPVDLPRVQELMERLNPRGRGPLTLALREAAKPLAALPGRRSVILIHDEADNCQQNVCAAADELRRASVTVHVVGLALRPDDATRMACVPQATGGRLYNVHNAEQLGAAVEEALRLAGAPAAAQAPAAAAPRPPRSGVDAAPARKAAAPVPPADAPPGIYAHAVLAAKGDVLEAPISWTVHAEGSSDAALAIVRAPFLELPLAPGRYVVEAREGPVRASQTVEVAAKGPTVVALALEAGMLRVRALNQKTGAPFGDAVVTIGTAGQGGEARKDAPPGPPVAAFKGSEGEALLPAGQYVVRVEQGLARTERAVVVPAGSRGRIDVPLNAARLQLSAVGRELVESGEVLTFSIAEDDPDAPRGRREVARAAGRQTEFVLPPGTYYVIARLGIIEARDSLAVGAGDVVRRTLSVAAGHLALSTRPIGQAPAEPVSYRIERIDVSPPEAIATSRPAPVLLLPAGRYRVEGRLGAMNARTLREVEVKVGQTQQVALEHQAAVLRLRLVGAGGPVLSDLAWEIRDEAGATVWTTGSPEPSAILQAGRYQVRADTRDKRYARDIDLRAGETRQLELTTD